MWVTSSCDCFDSCEGLEQCLAHGKYMVISTILAIVIQVILIDFSSFLKHFLIIKTWTVNRVKSQLNSVIKIKFLSSCVLRGVWHVRDPGYDRVPALKGLQHSWEDRTKVQTGVANGCHRYQVHEVFRQGRLSRECVREAMRRSKTLSYTLMEDRRLKGPMDVTWAKEWAWWWVAEWMTALEVMRGRGGEGEALSAGVRNWVFFWLYPDHALLPRGYSSYILYAQISFIKWQDLCSSQLGLLSLFKHAFYFFTPHFLFGQECLFSLTLHESVQNTSYMEPEQVQNSITPF